MLPPSSITVGSFRLPLTDLLKAIGTGKKISQQPYMVLTGYPPRWHKFDPAQHAGHTGPALHLKTQADAAHQLQQEFHDGHATPFHSFHLDHQMEQINGKAEATQAVKSAAAAVTYFKQAVLAGKQPSPGQLKAFNAMPEDKRKALLEQLKAAQPQTLPLILAAIHQAEKEAPAEAAPAPAAPPPPPAPQPAAESAPQAAPAHPQAGGIAVKGWKKAVAAGKVPTPAQMHAYAALDQDMKQALVHEDMPPGTDPAHMAAMVEHSKNHHAGTIKAKAAHSAAVGPVTNMDGWQQIGPQAGSNPGGKFQAPDGSVWYVKFPKSIDHAKNELLAAKLYAAAGVVGPSMELVEQDGKVGIAAQWVGGLEKGTGKDLASAPGAQEGFAVDAWLANWDVVGLGHDNLLLKDGKAVRVDTGGALLYRAQGGPKGEAFGNTVHELQTLTSASKNPQAAGVFGSMTKEALVASIDKVKAISNTEIQDLVSKFGPGGDDAKMALTIKLIKRKEYLEGYQSSLKPAVAAAGPEPKEGDTKPGANGQTLVLKDGHWVVQSPPVVAAKEAPAAASAGVPPHAIVPPPPPSTIGSATATLIVQSIQAAAAAGDIATVTDKIEQAAKYAKSTGKVKFAKVYTWAGDVKTAMLSAANLAASQAKAKETPAAAPAPAPAPAAPAPATPETAESTYEHTTDGHNKFWKVKVVGWTLVTTYGAIGTKPQTTEKGFGTHEEAVAAMAKLKAEKVGKGYQFKGSTAAASKPAPAVVSAKETPAPSAAATAPGAPGAPGAGHTVALADVKTQALAPTLSKKAIQGDNAVWYSQDSANAIAWAGTTSHGDQGPSEHAKQKLAELKAAKAAGYQCLNYKISGLQSVYVLQKNGQILTKQGMQALQAQASEEGDTKQENGHTYKLVNGHWERVDKDKPAPAEAPPAPVPAAAPAISADALHDLTQAIMQASLPDTNTNAGPVNKKLAAIAQAVKAKDLAALQAMTFGSNTYALKAKKIVQMAIGVLGGAPAGQPAVAAPAASPVVSAKETPKDGVFVPKVATAKGPKPPPKPKPDPSKLPVKPDQIPAAPVFTYSSKKHVNDANSHDAKQLHDYALKGNLTGLESYHYTAVDKEGGHQLGSKPIQSHPSQHVKSYWSELVASLQLIADPPEALREFSAVLGDNIKSLSAAFKNEKYGVSTAKAAANKKLAYFIALGKVATPAQLAPPPHYAPLKFESTPAKKIVVTSAQKAKAHADYAALGPNSLVKKFINAIQSSGSYNDQFRDGKLVGDSGQFSGVNLEKMNLEAHQYAQEKPAGFEIYKWIGLSQDMLHQLTSAPVGTVFQNPGSMCASTDPTATSGFGQHRMRIRYAPGAKGVDSFGSGNYGSEKEITTLPGARYVILSANMVECPMKGGKRLELDVLMLPPDETYVADLKARVAQGKGK